MNAIRAMLAQGRMGAPVVQGAVIVPPSYWLVFDGSNDHIALPAGYGQDPVTQIFVEAWIQDVPGTAARVLITRGDFFQQGYDFYLNVEADGDVNLSLSLQGVYTGYSGTIAKAGVDMSLPLHIAAGYDGSNIYYFIQGVLVDTRASSGTISYTNTHWTIGDMQQSSGVWPFSGKATQIRVSDVCRHTASFVPPTTFASDANTVGLWLAQEGSGTALADSGPGGYHGVFKGDGEPAWGDVADLATLSYGTALWDACDAILAHVTDTDIHIKRISADKYHVFRKVHASGPYWAKYVIERTVNTAMMVTTSVYVGIPDPANNTPSSWTTDPESLVQQSDTNEYVHEGHVGVEADFQWGSGHGYETMDTEGWYLNGNPLTLDNGEWANGATVEYRATGHMTSPGEVRACNITITKTFSKSLMYLDNAYTFDWLVDYYMTNSSFAVMSQGNSLICDKVTFRVDGTKYTVAGSGSEGYERSHCSVAWGDSNGSVLATYCDFEDGLRYGAAGGCVYINHGLEKVYFVRAKEVGIGSGDSWHYHTRTMALDNCGAHFLKPPS